MVLILSLNRFFKISLKLLFSVWRLTRGPNVRQPRWRFSTRRVPYLRYVMIALFNISYLIHIFQLDATKKLEQIRITPPPTPPLFISFLYFKYFFLIFLRIIFKSIVVDPKIILKKHYPRK